MQLKPFAPLTQTKHLRLCRLTGCYVDLPKLAVILLFGLSTFQGNASGIFEVDREMIYSLAFEKALVELDHFKPGDLLRGGIGIHCEASKPCMASVNLKIRESVSRSIKKYEEGQCVEAENFSLIIVYLNEDSTHSIHKTDSAGTEWPVDCEKHELST